MKILVTGATGKLGSKVVEALLKTISPEQLAISVRDPKKAENLKARGVEVRQGDFDRQETLVSAFSHIERLLIISTDGDNETRIRQHINAITAAKETQVKFIAYTSVAKADNNSLSLAEVHRASEEAIRKTGIPYTFLRNNWYLENEIGSIQGVLAGAPWVTSAGSGRVGWALQKDYADAAAAVLTGSGHENKIYELSGKPLTQQELVSALGAVLGKEIPVQQVEDAQYAAIMQGAGVPEFVLPLLIGIQKGIRDGALDVEHSDFETLLGRSAVPVQEALAQIVSEIGNA